MLNLIYIFLIIVVIKFLLNLPKYFQCKYYLNKYHDYLSNDNNGWDFVESKPNVVKLIKGAGVNDSTLPIVTPIGYGKLMTANVSVFDNLTSKRVDVVEMTLSLLHQAIGVYRLRMFETFNPLYWIEFVLNLPKEILVFLGVSTESLVLKIAQLLYWGAGLIVAFLLTLYRVELETFVRDWISRLAP